MSTFSNNVWHVSLCLTLCMTAASSAQEQDHAQESLQKTDAPAVVLDPAFDRYFDLALFAPAVERGDAEVLADLTMQAAVGEEVLLRSHKAASAKEIARVAKDVAFGSGNELALDRLLQFARKTNDKQLVDEIETRRKLGGGSRAASEMLNVDDIAVEDLQSFQDYRSDIQLARRLGIRSKLEQIRDDPNLRDLPAKLHDQILKALEQALTELEDTTSPLSRLIGASRECKNQRNRQPSLPNQPGVLPVRPVPDPPPWNTVQQLVEIEINGPTPYDDYLTWAPTPGRIRLPRDARSNGPVIVCLTNDTGSVGGDVLFAPFQYEWPRYTTATESILTLTLPAYTGDDEGWVYFVVAGAFGHPSERDKDTIIDARLESPGGVVLGSHAMMVRVRKAAHRMNADERDRYLAVLERMRPQDGSADMIQYFEDVHREAGPRSHKGPSFLPWHRAFLLQFERQLQAIDPSVSLPYWDWSSDVSQLLTGDFLGNSSQEVVEFDGLNPIRNWTSGNQRILRRPGVQGIYMGAQDPRVENAFQQTTYGPYPQGFGVDLEQRLHDEGHGWVGGTRGWMADAGKAAQDPLFYLHHCNVDRTWAQWQYVHDRFGDSTPVDYWPPGDYTPGNGYPGNNLEAMMWPWNESVSSSFPASGRLGVWPPEPTVPRPRDMIDYLGVKFPAVDLGFCYDDVQFGTAASGAVQSPPSPLVSRDINRMILVSMPAPQPTDAANDRAVQDFFNVQLPPDQRQQAGEAIQYLSRDHFGNIGLLICNEQEPEALRIIAIKKVPAAAILDSLLHVLETAPADQRTELAVAAAQAVRVATVSESGHDQRQQIARVLRRFINTPCSEVRDVSLAVLVGSHDPEAVRFIKDSLEGRVEGCNLPPADAIALLAFDDPVQHLNVIRPFLNSPDADVCVEAIRAVEFDPATRQAVSELLQDRERPLEVRRAALKASERDMPTCLATVRNMIMDANEAPELRAEAVNALAGIVSSRVRTINQHAQRAKLGYREPLADTIPALSDAGRVEIAGILDQLANQPGPDAVRADAAKVLRWLQQNDPALQAPVPQQPGRAAIPPAIDPRVAGPVPHLPTESIVQTYGIGGRGNIDQIPAFIGVAEGQPQIIQLPMEQALSNAQGVQTIARVQLDGGLVALKIGDRYLPDFAREIGDANVYREVPPVYPPMAGERDFISLESANKPGTYLRHQSMKVFNGSKIPNEEEKVFQQDVTWHFHEKPIQEGNVDVSR